MKIFIILDGLQNVILEEERRGICLKLFYSEQTREFSCMCFFKDAEFLKKQINYKKAYDALIFAIRAKKHDIEIEL